MPHDTGTQKAGSLDPIQGGNRLRAADEGQSLSIYLLEEIAFL
jgi:hypothetical protein